MKSLGLDVSLCSKEGKTGVLVCFKFTITPPSAQREFRSPYPNSTCIRVLLYWLLSQPLHVNRK